MKANENPTSKRQPLNATKEGRVTGMTDWERAKKNEVAMRKPVAAVSASNDPESQRSLKVFGPNSSFRCVQS